jgi:hypothetical protein
MVAYPSEKKILQHWAHKTQDENKQNTENGIDEKHGPHHKPWVNTGANEG